MSDSRFRNWRVHAAASPAFPWERVPGIRAADFKDGFLVQVARMLEEVPCYGRCKESVATCLRKDPTHSTAARLARDIFLLMAKEAGSEEIKKWVDARKRMADPAVERATFNLEGLTPLGKKDAPVVVVEFSDFQCPMCAQVAPVLERVVRESNGQVRFYLKQFPLKGHSRAIEAAKACVAAEAFGKSWDVCGKLFENQRDLSDERLLKIGKDVGIPPEAFKMAMARDEVLDRIADEKIEGLKHRIEATPAIFIDGKPLLLPPTPELLKDRVEEELDILANRD